MDMNVQPLGETLEKDGVTLVLGSVVDQNPATLLERALSLEHMQFL